MNIVAIVASAFLTASDAEQLADSDVFVKRCIAAFGRDGRPAETSTGPCECIARRTQDRPQLRVEFLEHLNALKADREMKPSQELRQVRTACIPMPIWGWTGTSLEPVANN